MPQSSNGIFGEGMYFASTFDLANSKAHLHEATIEADVVLGYSLVCRKNMNGMTDTLLRKTYGCNSVKGEECLPDPEYVVYNWSQISIRIVRINSEVYYETGVEREKKLCNNSVCGYFGKKHIGKCRILWRVSLEQLLVSLH